MVFFFVTLFYCTWEYKNKRIFYGDSDFAYTVNHFNLLVEEFLVLGSNSKESSMQPTWDDYWTRPYPGWLKANVDATYYEGKASLAVVVRDDRGEIIELSLW